MKSQENNIAITGHLAGEPKLKPTRAGRSVCDMRLAVQNGRHPSFHLPVSAFDGQAHYCADHLSSGDPVRVEGVFRFRRWRDRAGKWREEFSVAGVVRPLGEAPSEQTEQAAVPARLPTKEERRRLIRARASLRVSVPIATYKLWVRPLRLAGLTAEAIHLVAPAHTRAWVERRYSALIGGALRAEDLPDRVSFASASLATTRAVVADGVLVGSSANSEF